MGLQALSAIVSGTPQNAFTGRVGFRFGVVDQGGGSGYYVRALAVTKVTGMTGSITVEILSLANVVYTSAIIDVTSAAVGDQVWSDCPPFLTTSSDTLFCAMTVTSGQTYGDASTATPHAGLVSSVLAAYQPNSTGSVLTGSNGQFGPVNFDLVSHRPSPEKETKPPLGSLINWGHPLANGLRSLVLFNEGTAAPFADLACRNDSFTNDSIYYQPTTGLSGPNIYVDGANFNGPGIINSKQIFNSARATVALKLQIYSGLPPGARFIGGVKQNTTTYDKVFMLNSRGISFYAYDGNSRTTINCAIDPDRMYTAVGVCDGTLMKIYIDGTLYDYQTCGPSYAAYTGSNLAIGSTVLGLNSHQFYVDTFAVWDRALSATEVLNYTTAPYSMINRPKARRWALSASTPPAPTGGTVSLLNFGRGI